MGRKREYHKDKPSTSAERQQKHRDKLKAKIYGVSNKVKESARVPKNLLNLSEQKIINLGVSDTLKVAILREKWAREKQIKENPALAKEETPKIDLPPELVKELADKLAKGSKGAK